MKLMAALLLGLVIACDSGSDDKKLNDAVRQRLAGEPTPAVQLQISTKERVVTLSGVVATEAERDRILRIVRDTDRVLGIDNRLTVQRPVETTGASDLAFNPADRAIRDSIRRGIDRAGIKGVSIDVRDGIVRLGGDVPPEKHDETLQIAKDPENGATRVDDHLGEL
jgi:osmotically-inducible protein OsmY